jgi:hypothetical protein
LYLRGTQGVAFGGEDFQAASVAESLGERT